MQHLDIHGPDTRLVHHEVARRVGEVADGVGLTADGAHLPTRRGHLDRHLRCQRWLYLTREDESVSNLQDRSGPHGRRHQEQVDLLSLEGHDRPSGRSPCRTLEWRKDPCPDGVIVVELHSEGAVNGDLADAEVGPFEDGGAEQPLDVFA